MKLLRSPYFLHVFFPVAALVVALLVTSMAYTLYQFDRHAQRMRLTDLESLREAKITEVVDYLNTHISQVGALGRSPVIAQAMKQMNVSWHDAVASTNFHDQRLGMFDEYFQRFVQHWHYYNLFFINLDGDIIYSVKHEADFATNLLHGPYRDTALGKVFRQSVWFLQATNSGFERYAPSAGRPAAFIAVPVIAREKLLGVLAVQLNADDIYRLMRDLTGMGDTGETVAGRLYHGHIQITIPLRHNENAAFNVELPLSSSIAQPIILGTQGKTGHAITRDWRNKEVLATWEYLPHLQWGVVNKIDTSEAMVGVQQVYTSSVLVVLLALLCAFWLAFLIARRVVVPVTKLSRAVRRFTLGDHQIRVSGPFPANELGVLMRDSNTMMHKVMEHDIAMRRMVHQLEHQNTLLDRKVIEKSERLQAVIHHATDGIMTLDVHGNIELVNPAACRIFGYDESTMLQKRLVDLFSSENPCRQIVDLFHYAGASMDHTRHTFELKGKRRDGEVFAMEVSVSDLQGNETKTGSPLFLLILRDISEAKRQREKMEHSQRLESLGVLAGGIAHDFNNLLTAIMGNAALAQAQVDKQSPIGSMLSNIENASEKAAQLCRQMLAYSGKGRFVVRHVNLNEMVQDMISLLEVSIHKSTILKLELSKQALPPVLADEAQLQQVVMNLVINASEAMEERSGMVRIRTGVSLLDAKALADMGGTDCQPGHYVWLQVADNGCGMDEATQQKLFDPFFTTKFTGRGLGMSATLGIVRGHHGLIQVRSQPGKGTTFDVFFPVAESAEVVLPAEAHEQDDEHWRGEGTILVIDDEETIRTTASMMLQRMGFSTLLASDGERGVQLFREHQQEIRAVLLDMTMPGLSGRETLSQLRTIAPDVIVILSSGYSEQEAASQFAGQGLNGFVQKPYSLQTLRQKMQSYLGKHG